MQEMMYKSFDGTNLYVKKETADDNIAVAVIVHGLCEHQGRYDYLANRFHENKIGTYRFDHRGHGRSEGERTYYNDYNELIEDVHEIVKMALKENTDKPVFLLGHSMGGYAVALYGTKYSNENLRGIVTSGALTYDHIKLISALDENLDPHMLLKNELGDGVCSVKEVVDWYTKDPYNTQTFTPGLCFALTKGLKWFEQNSKNFAYPVLMLHGENDALVSFKDTCRFFESTSSKDRQMKLYGGLFHEIFNEYCRDEVIDDAINWILKRV